MTQAQKNQIAELTRIAGTVLLAITGFFLIRTINQLDEINRSIHKMELNMVEVKTDVKVLKDLVNKDDK